MRDWNLAGEIWGVSGKYAQIWSRMPLRADNSHIRDYRSVNHHREDSLDRPIPLENLSRTCHISLGLFVRHAGYDVKQRSKGRK